MKLIHLSDLHISKRVNEIPMAVTLTGEQGEVVSRLLPFIKPPCEAVLP